MKQADRFVIRPDLRFLESKLTKALPLTLKQQSWAEPLPKKNYASIDHLLPLHPAQVPPTAPIDNQGILFTADNRFGVQILLDRVSQHKYGMPGLTYSEASAMLLYLCDAAEFANAALMAQRENVQLVACLKAYMAAHEEGRTPSAKEIKAAEKVISEIDNDQQATNALSKATAA